MRTYYIILETSKKLAWKIRKTKNNLDTSDGLQKEIEDLDIEYGEVVIILYWKRLDKKWYNF